MFTYFTREAWDEFKAKIKELKNAVDTKLNKARMWIGGNYLSLDFLTDEGSTKNGYYARVTKPDSNNIKELQVGTYKENAETLVYTIPATTANSFIDRKDLTNANADTLYTAGTYRITRWDSDGKVSGLPAGSYPYGMLVVFASTVSIVQVYFSDSSTSDVYIRSLWSTANGWKAWRKINTSAI